MSVRSGRMQRGPTALRAPVNLSSLGQQDLGHVDMARPSRLVQRGPATAGSRIDRSTGSEQNLRSTSMSVRSGRMQRGPTALRAPVNL
ncbi:MAG: hypothetical protein OXC13_01445, partial [Caldilineaceae bacterium]|nr:hypothetical protein [Caldilineaceae bacterium]